MNITTGKKIVVKRVEAVGGTHVEGFDPTALFDQKSTKTTSHFLNIDSCKAMKLSTFGLKDGAYLTLHRVLLGGAVFPQSSGCLCECEDGEPIKVLANEPLKIDCKPVVLDNCNSVLFLSIPGTYVLELNDPTQLGHFLAFAEVVDCCCLPEGLVIGNRASERYIGTKRG